ncbi:MAG: hypothetical protein HC933_18665 [Pleurocapsa sp. SU_196_0]|nr:hypothetical protein [Pleurocapsa sp. SU_196_0]
MMQWVDRTDRFHALFQKLTRLLVLLIFVAAVDSAGAQVSSFGVRFDGQLTNIANFAIPMFGFQIGTEWELADTLGSVGARISSTSLAFFISRFAVDATYRAPVFPDGSSLYGGIGGSFLAAFIFGTGFFDLHGLIGYQFPSGWWLEGNVGLGFTPTNCNFPATPDCSSGRIVNFVSFALSFGFNWFARL